MSAYTGYLSDGEWLCESCAPEGAEEVQDRGSLGWGCICTQCGAQITPERPDDEEAPRSWSSSG